jgi:hypothetical protein
MPRGYAATVVSSWRNVGRPTGERPELGDQVRLIGEAAREGELAPAHRPSERARPFEAEESRRCLRREPDLLPEAGGQALAAPAELLCQRPDANRAMAYVQPLPGEDHACVRRSSGHEAAAELAIEEREAGVPSRDSCDALRQVAGKQLLERHRRSCQLVQRYAQEHVRRPRRERDLKAVHAPVVLRHDLVEPQAADEGQASLAVDPPFVVEREDQHDIGSRTFAPSRGRLVGREPVVGGDRAS